MTFNKQKLTHLITREQALARYEEVKNYLKNGQQRSDIKAIKRCMHIINKHLSKDERAYIKTLSVDDLIEYTLARYRTGALARVEFNKKLDALKIELIKTGKKDTERGQQECLAFIKKNKKSLSYLHNNRDELYKQPLNIVIESIYKTASKSYERGKNIIFD